MMLVADITDSQQTLEKGQLQEAHRGHVHRQGDQVLQFLSGVLGRILAVFLPLAHLLAYITVGGGLELFQDFQQEVPSNGETLGL